MARRLTNRQREVLTHIRAVLERTGRPPTLRELGARLGIRSTNGVRDHLEALVAKGYLARDARSARGLRLLRAAPAPTAADLPAPPAVPVGVRRVPLLGGVAAGQPLFADQELGDALLLDERVVSNGGAVFALRVRGDSMQDAAIHDGDYVVVREQRSAEPGDIVVALLEDEATVKRFFPERDFVRLQPENSQHAPVIVRRDDRSMRLLGKVTAVISHRP